MKARALVLGVVLALAPSPRVDASPCAHGEFYRVALRKCVARSSPLARFVHFRHHELPRARPAVDHDSPLAKREARPDAPALPPTSRASGLTPRGPESQRAVVTGDEVYLPFALPPSRLDHQTVIQWRLP
jgi:hypothetical protein